MSVPSEFAMHGQAKRQWPHQGNDATPDNPGIDLALAELRADLEDSALPWRADVSLAQDLPVSLRQMVLQHSVGLQRAANRLPMAT